MARSQNFDPVALKKKLKEWRGKGRKGIHGVVNLLNVPKDKMPALVGNGRMMFNDWWDLCRKQAPKGNKYAKYTFPELEKKKTPWTDKTGFVPWNVWKNSKINLADYFPDLDLFKATCGFSPGIVYFQMMLSMPCFNVMIT